MEKKKGNKAAESRSNYFPITLVVWQSFREVGAMLRGSFGKIYFISFSLKFSSHVWSEKKFCGATIAFNPIFHSLSFSLLHQNN